MAVPTYFIVGGEDANPVDGLPPTAATCVKPHVPRPSGLPTPSDGLKVAYLSGAYDRDSTRAGVPPGRLVQAYYLREDVQRVVDAARTGEEEELRAWTS